jgi:hypothetical protein
MGASLETWTVAELLRNAKPYRKYLLAVAAAIAAVIYLGATLADDHGGGVTRPPMASHALPVRATADAPSTPVAEVIAAEPLPAPAATRTPAAAAATPELGSIDPGGPPAAPAPLADLVAELGPAAATVIGTLGVVLAPINNALPPIPVPPFIAVPHPPAAADPVLAALQPATGAACGNLATAFVLAALVGLPIPITPTHMAATFAEVLSACSALTPSTPATPVPQ